MASEPVLITTLDTLDASYMLVGGVVLAAWAPPRATTDLDIAIAVPAEDLLALGKLLARRVGGADGPHDTRRRRR